MKQFRIISLVILLFIIPYLGIKIFKNFNSSSDFKKEEKIRLKEAAEILNQCFDLKNKSQRKLNESMKLIEYCLEKYGS